MVEKKTFTIAHNSFIASSHRSYNVKTIGYQNKRRGIMKKMSVIVVALGLAVSLLGIANAGNRHMGGGCGNCVQDGAGASSDPFRKFQADTIDLRQEMMTKRFDVQRENLKATPDQAKIAALQSEIKSIQANLLALRAQSGLPVDKCDGECAQTMGGCDKTKMGGCGKGPCGQK